MPPTVPLWASISWNSAQAALARSSVSVSTYHEPCAGSVTRAAALSSWSTSWVLRAMRRAKASGLPSAQLNGSTVMASAPPKAAPAQAMVVRRMFTHGSRLAIIRSEVEAVSWMDSAALPAPQASATLATRRRAARSLATVRNRSASAASARAILPSAMRGLSPAASQARR